MPEPSCKLRLSVVLLTIFTHASGVAAVDPRISPNCENNNPPHLGGETWFEEINFDETDYTHQYSLPDGYNSSVPVPLMLFFHGWGGNSGACGSTCTEASARGYATISLQGIGAENGDRASWNGFGSNESGMSLADAPLDALTAPERICDVPQENDRTCNVNAYDVACYEDCNNACADNCWWTTCKDSVAQTLAVLESFLDIYCIDLDRIYASGCSNGGMFVYELAHDERMAQYLAAVAPMVGLPHYGYNRGPNGNYPLSHIGFWGARDRTVPPIEGDSNLRCEVECRTSENRGWFYTSSACTMDKWVADMGLTENGFSHQDYGIPGYSRLSECWSTGSISGDIVVAGCHFDGGHICNQNYVNDVMLNFFDAHARVGSSPPSTSSPQPTPTPTSPPTMSNPQPTPTPTSRPTTSNPQPTPTPTSSCQIHGKRKDCDAAEGCTWSKGSCV